MPAYIPVTTDECLCETDKFLYNIWQKIISGALIPAGPITQNQPLGWDVNSITNSLLYNIMIAITGGGGGGGGTVTSVGATSNSLDFSATAPNPIIGAGTIQMELQIIQTTRAGFVGDLNAGRLLPDVTYEITDPLTPLDQMFARAAGTNRVDCHFFGYINGQYVNVGYDKQYDCITMLHCPRLNNWCFRTVANAAIFNCIEAFDVTHGQFFNCWLEDCDFASDMTVAIDGLKVMNEGNVVVNNGANVDGCFVDSACDVFITGCNVFKCRFGNRVYITLDDTLFLGDYDCVEFDISQTVTSLSYNGGFQQKKYAPYLQDSLLTAAALNGGTLIVDNFYNNIRPIQLAPAAAIASYTLQLPFNPQHGQIILCSTLQAITAFTIDPNTHFITSNITTLAANQHFALYYDGGTDRWYQV